jgi:hypothetical protein
MKRILMTLFAFTVMALFASRASAEDWVYLGQTHVDGQHDHDNVEVGAAGRYRFFEVRVKNAPIELDRVVIHYASGDPQIVKVPGVIRAGGKSNAIRMDGDRILKSLELWYSKAAPNSGKPELTLWGQH